MIPTHAGGVVYRARGRRREFLVVTARRNPGHWVLPKGHVEPGESPEAAAVREVFEETGVTAQVESPLEDVQVRVGQEDQRIRFFLMRALHEGGPREAMRLVVWLDAGAADERLSFPESRSTLAAALKALG